MVILRSQNNKDTDFFYKFSLIVSLYNGPDNVSLHVSSSQYLYE